MSEMENKTIKELMHKRRKKFKKLFDKKQLPIIGIISPQDIMYQKNDERYFFVGQSALHCIETAMLGVGKQKAEINTILDLPCGLSRKPNHSLRFRSRCR